MKHFLGPSLYKSCKVLCDGLNNVYVWLQGCVCVYPLGTNLLEFIAPGCMSSTCYRTQTHIHIQTHTLRVASERDLAYQLLCQAKRPMCVSKNYVFGMASTLKHLKTVKRPVIPPTSKYALSWCSYICLTKAL